MTITMTTTTTATMTTNSGITRWTFSRMSYIQLLFYSYIVVMVPMTVDAFDILSTTKLPILATNNAIIFSSVCRGRRERDRQSAAAFVAKQRPAAAVTSITTTALLSSSITSKDASSSLCATTTTTTTRRLRIPLVGRFSKGHRTTSQSIRQEASSLSTSSSSSKPFLIPSLFNSNDSRPIVLFDGKCNLCNAGVQLILDYDRADVDPRGNLRVAAMQSHVGQLLLGRLSERERKVVLGMTSSPNKINAKDNEHVGIIDDDDTEMEYKSIVVMTPTSTYLNSNACLSIGKELSGPLRVLSYIAGYIPNFLRDKVYKLLSRNRKRLFGSSTECRLWDDNWDTRFVDDSILTTGEAAAIDPFADPNKNVVVTAASNNDGLSLLLRAGDMVRVVVSSTNASSSRMTTTIPTPPVLHTHIPGYENGICTVGSVGTVTRVLNGRAYPKNVVVKFELDVGGYCYDSKDVGKDRKCTVPKTCSFEAHFFPWQLQKA